MRTIHKTILSGSAMILMTTVFAVSALAQSANLKSSDLSIQNTQSLVASRAEKSPNSIAPFRTVAPEAERERTTNFEMANINGGITPKASSWENLSDEAKKSFGDQLGQGALRWSSEMGETSSSVRKENGGLFVSRGPKPLQSRVQN